MVCVSPSSCFFLVSSWTRLGTDSTAGLNLLFIFRKEVIVKKGRVLVDYHPPSPSLPITPLHLPHLLLHCHLPNSDSPRHLRLIYSTVHPLHRFRIGNTLVVLPFHLHLPYPLIALLLVLLARRGHLPRSSLATNLPHPFDRIQCQS